jgi:hypothetical protein
VEYSSDDDSNGDGSGDGRLGLDNIDGIHDLHRAYLDELHFAG